MDDHRNLPPGHRGIRLGELPTASLVIASASDRATLEECLAHVLPSCIDRGVEVVVARSCSADEYHDLERMHPKVLFMPAQDHATVRQLRAIGLAAADGDIVTMLEDTDRPGPLWLADLLPTVRRPAPPGDA